MLPRCRRGGVPVLSRPQRKPNDLSDSASGRRRRLAGPSGRRASGPTWIRPFRNVPVVTTSASAAQLPPVLQSQAAAPGRRPRRFRRQRPRSQLDARRSRRAFHASRRDRRLLVHLCAGRPDRRATAAIEQAELNTRRIRRPGPSARRARRSRGRDGPWRFPPTAGLHGICATVSSDSVQRPTRQPRRAAAQAASHPAWPAPTTITSNTWSSGPSPSTTTDFWLIDLFSNAEAAEDFSQEGLAGPPARHFFKGVSGFLKFEQDKFLWQTTKT